MLKIMNKKYIKYSWIGARFFANRLSWIALLSLVACQHIENQPEVQAPVPSILYRMGTKDGTEMCKQRMPNGSMSDFFPCPRDIFVRIVG